MKHERDFADKIARDNAWTAGRAVLMIVFGEGVTLGMMLLFRDTIHEPAFWRLTAVVMLLFAFVSWMAWAIRGMVRYDLYTVAQGKSLVELQRFKGEVEELIDKIAAERDSEERIVPVRKEKRT